MSSLYEQLRQIRKDSGLQQKAFAERIGISLRQYQKIEYGRVNIKLSTLFKILRGLNMHLICRKNSNSEATNQITYRVPIDITLF